jgi:uncharacterized protein (TIGR02996 family)
MSEREHLDQLRAGDGLAPRRVYADWLEENGRADDAEFLRLQCQAAEVDARLLALVPTRRSEWLAEVGTMPRSRSLTLRGGREVSLQNLRQFHVYEGLLEGSPTKELNARIIDNVLSAEASQGRPYLIAPVERPIATNREPPFGTPAQLPPIACVARLQSRPVKLPEADYSELTVVWFQDDYAMPIDPRALQHLLFVDWAKHAIDHQY